MKIGDRLNRLDQVVLTGKKVKSESEDTIVLEADGALMSISKSDIRASEEQGAGVHVLYVNSNARILFETLLSPQEAGGILSREAMIEIRAEPTECSRCSTECSRCSTECSRCATSELSSPGIAANVFRRRLA
jgi:hypothetical protein